MKWNLIKLGVAALAAVIIIGVVAALVSGFMTAFKPDSNATTSSTTGYSGGGARGGGGMSSAVATPVAGASPVPFAYGGPGGVPGGMSSQGMPPEGASGMQQMPASPGAGFATAPASSAMSGPQSGYASQQQPGMEYPYPAGAMPSQQTQPAGEGEAGSDSSGSSSPQFSATSSPVTFLGGRTGSWFNASPAAGVSAPGVSAQQPVSASSPLPGQEQGQGQRQQSPVFIPPASSGAGTPAVSDEQLSPYETGWRQVLLKLLEVLPLMFPGYFPGLQWYTVSSAY